MTCICERPIVPCIQALPGDPCMVRCLHERPRAPSHKVPCEGWAHTDGWHLCDPSASHRQIATPAP